MISPRDERWPVAHGWSSFETQSARFLFDEFLVELPYDYAFFFITVPAEECAAGAVHQNAVGTGNRVRPQGYVIVGYLADGPTAVGVGDNSLVGDIQCVAVVDQ